MEDIIEKCKKSRLPEGDDYIFGKEAILQKDINILEELINRCKECKFATCEQCYINWTQVQAIENLIARNKELEEYKKIAELTKISCCTAQNCEALNNAIREGLENTKLKEKIEKLESALNNSVSKDEINEKIEEYTELVNDFEKYWSKDPRKFKKEKSVDYYKIEALQELLNKGE